MLTSLLLPASDYGAGARPTYEQSFVHLLLVMLSAGPDLTFLDAALSVARCLGTGFSPFSCFGVLYIAPLCAAAQTMLEHSKRQYGLQTHLFIVG